MSDVREDGNLLKVNSCNCAGKLDEAKEGVSMVSITMRRENIVKEGNECTSKRAGEQTFINVYHLERERESLDSQDLHEWNIRIWLCCFGLFLIFVSNGT